MATVLPRWTLVQHSGYGYAADGAFACAVETRQVTGAPAQRKVLDAGGVLLPTYEQAEDAAEKVNYPPGTSGLIPACRGGFSGRNVDGLAIYQPHASEAFPMLVGVGVQ